MLAELEKRTIEQAAAKYRSRAIAYGLCGLFVLVALYHGSVAILLALEPDYGMIGARLWLAGGYALAAIAAGLALRYGLQGRTIEQGGRETTKVSLAMIVEALILGYSWSRGGSLVDRRER